MDSYGFKGNLLEKTQKVISDTELLTVFGGATIDSHNKWSHTNLVDSIEVTVTSVSNKEGQSLYHFYPNPTNSGLWIEVNNILEKNHLQVMDIQGRLVLLKELKQGRQKVALPQLAAGAYVLRFVNEEGVFSKRWVVN